MPVKLTQQQAEQKILEFNKEYQLISKYISGIKPVMLKHSCGYEYKIGRYKSFFEGKNKCPICYPSQSNSGHSTKKVTEEDLINRLKEQVNEEYSYISGFTKMDAKTSIFKHNKCGHEFLVAPKMFLGVKQTRCPICSNRNRGNYLRDENFLQKILNDCEDGNEYQWLDNYNFDNKEKLKILHKECNRTYHVRPNDFQQGYRCPHCSSERHESKYVLYMKELLEINNIDFKKEEYFKGLEYKDKLKCDIFIPSLNIIIEYDGEQHFKSSGYITPLKLEENQKRDQIKNEYFLSSNYNFLRIPYYSIYSFEDIDSIINELLKNKTLSVTTCSKYTLFFSDKGKDFVINKNKYYNDINRAIVKAS